MIQIARAGWAVAILFAGMSGTMAQAPLTSVATAALLAATPTASKTAMLRLGYHAAGDAPPVVYAPLRGTCAANRLAGDGGGCIDTNAGDGNAWKGQLGPLIAFEEFGAKGDGMSDDSAAINNAIAYQCANPSWEIRPRLNATYAIAHPVVDHCGAKVMGGLGRIMSWQVSADDAPLAPFIVKWVGGARPAPFYMADIGAAANPTAAGRRVYNGMWVGVLWDCDGAAGCGGALLRSVAKGRYDMGAWEPRPALYTAAPSKAHSNKLNLAATAGLATGMSVAERTTYAVATPGSCPGGDGCPGSTMLPLTGTAGIRPGMVVLSAYIPANATVTGVGAESVRLSQPIGPVGFRGGESVGFSHLAAGTQVWTVDSPTQVSLTAAIQVPYDGGERIGFGGEGIRVDVTQSLREVNDTQDNLFELSARNTGPGIEGPGIVLGAVNVPGQGSAGDLAHYGNFSSNQIPFLECSYLFHGNACVVMGDSDHNHYGAIATGIDYAGVVAVGQLPSYGAVGGPARFFVVDRLSGNFAFEGTELGFAAPPGPLGIDFPQIDTAGAWAGLTPAGMGTGNRGIRWRFDRSEKWLSNDPAGQR